MDYKPVNIWSMQEQINLELGDNAAYNSSANWGKISALAMSGEDVCLSTLPRVQGIPALVLGSGPTLDEAAPFLNQWPGVIFSGPSQVRICDKWKRQPDFVVAVDSSPVVAEQLKGPLYSHETSLVPTSSITL